MLFVLVLMMERAREVMQLSAVLLYLANSVCSQGTPATIKCSHAWYIKVRCCKFTWHVNHEMHQIDDAKLAWLDYLLAKMGLPKVNS